MRENVKEAWQACQIDNIDALKKLVPETVSPNASTFDPTNHVHTLLMCAAAHGAINCCQYLIDQKAEKSQKNFSGYTALHWAAYTGREECLRILLGDLSNNSSSYSLIESQTEDGKTALHIAALRGHLNFIRDLISYGADINAISSNGWTALHFALTSNQKDVCQYLLSEKIKSEAPDMQGKTVFDIAEQYKRNWFMEMFEKYQKEN